MSWYTLALTVSFVGGAIVLAGGPWLHSRRSIRWAQIVTTALLWVWIWGALAMTFGTKSGGGSSLNLRPLDVTNRADLVDFALNITMFLPLGILLAVRGTRLWQATVTGAVISLGIEVMQYVLATGRTADINDFLSNSVGCVLGFLIVSVGVRPYLLRRKPLRA